MNWFQNNTTIQSKSDIFYRATIRWTAKEYKDNIVTDKYLLN